MLESRQLLAVDAFSRIWNDAISTPSEVDVFEIENERVRDVVFTVDTNVAEVFEDRLGSARLEVLDPGGIPIFSRDFFGVLGSPSIALDQIGTYSTRVLNDGSTGGENDAGPYELHVADLNPDPVGTLTVGGGLIENTEVYNQALAYEFPVTSNELGESITIGLGGSFGSRSLEVIAPGGQSIAAAGSSFGAGVRLAFEADSLEDGGFGEGVYTLQIQLGGPSQVVEPATFELYINDELNASDSMPIERGGAVTGSIQTYGQRDAWSFVGTADEEVTVQLSEAFTFGRQLALEVFDELGQSIAGSNGADTRLTFALPSDGTYTVVVDGTGSSDQGTGPYVLTISDPLVDSGSLGLGQSTLVRWDALAPVHEFTVNVLDEWIGRPLSIMTFDPDAVVQPLLEIFAPGSTESLPITREDFNRTSVLRSHVLSEAGTYRVRVSAPNQVPGQLVVAVSDEPLVATQTISVGSRIADVMDRYGKTLAYEFVADSDETITINGYTYGSLTLEATIRDSTGSVVAEANLAANQGQRLTFDPLTGETYRLELRGAARYASGLGSFSIDLASENVPSAWPSGDDSSVELIDGRTHVGVIAGVDEIDTYTFDATRGERVRFHAAGIQDPDSSYRPAARLYDPGGVVVWEGGMTVNSPQYFDSGNLILPSDGTYRLEFESSVFSGGDTFGPYIVSMDRTTFDTSNSTRLDSGASTVRQFDSVASTELFHFEAVEGQQFNMVASSSLPTHVPLKLELFDDSGNRIYVSEGATNDGGFSRDARLGPMLLPLTGIYFARVSTFGPSQQSALTTPLYQLDFQLFEGNDAIQIVPGSTTTGEIPSGRTQRFEVDVQAGQRLSIAAISSYFQNSFNASPGIDLRVVHPSGREVAIVDRGRHATLHNLLANQTGIYTIELIAPESGGTAYYALSVDTVDDAKDAIELDEATHERFVRPTERHRYGVNVSSPQPVTLQLTSLALSNTAYRVSLIDGSGTVVRQWAPGNTREFESEFFITNSGDQLVVEVDHADGRPDDFNRSTDPSSGFSAYELKLSLAAPDAIATSPTQVISLDSIESVTIDPVDSVVDVSLTIDGDDVGSPISILAGEREFSSSFAAVIELYDPSGRRVAFADSDSAAASFNVPLIEDYVPRVAGDYTIRVYEDRGDAAEPQTLEISVTRQDTNTPVVLPGFSQELAGEITTPGGFQEWTFDASAGDRVRTQKLLGGFHFDIVDPAGNILARQVASSQPGWGPIAVLPTTGSYRLRVQANRDPGINTSARDNTGQFELRIHHVEDSVAVAIDFGQTVNASVDVAGEVLEYQFVATAQEVGKPVSITVGERSVGSGFQARAVLIDPAGNEVAVSSPATQYFTVAQITDYHIDTAGTYTIRVSEVGDNAVSDSFTVHLSDQPVHPNGVPLIPDAGPATFTIAEPGQVDTYQFNAGGGQQFRVLVGSQTSGTMYRIDVVDSLGQVRASAFPDNTGDTTLDRFHVPADDTYSLRIRADGFSVNAQDNLGDYSIELLDIGNYAQLVSGNVTATPELSTIDPATIDVSWTITNQGTDVGPTDRWTDAVVLSRDDEFGNFDDRIVARFVRRGTLDPGQSYSRNESIVLPPATEGEFRVFVVTDIDQVVYEDDQEQDNAASSSDLIRVATAPFSDLLVSSVTAPGESQSGQSITVTWNVTNDSARAVATTNWDTWADRVLLVRDPVNPLAPGSWVASLASINHIGALAVGDSYNEPAEAEVTLPLELDGTFYIAVQTNAGGTRPYEFIYTDNNVAVSGPITITQAPLPDLVVSHPTDPSLAIVAPPTAGDGDTIDITWTVENASTVSAPGPWFDNVTLEESNGTRRFQLGSFTFAGDLASLDSYTRTEQVTLPAGIIGTFRVVVEADRGDRVVERDDANVFADIETIEITPPPRPNLQVRSVEAPDSGQAGDSYAVRFDVINQSTIATGDGRWSDRVYLSQDDSVSFDDILLGETQNQRSLESFGEYRSDLIDFTIPVDLRGTWYILAIADAGDQVGEFPNEGDNVFVHPIEIAPIPPADLVTSNVIAPDQAFAGSEIEVRFLVTNHGVGTTSTDTWVDTVWLANDRRRPGFAVGPAGDYSIGTFAHTVLVEIGESYERIVRVRIPEYITSGEYFITPFADSSDLVIEDTRDTHINDDDPNEIDNNNYKARAITIVGVPASDTAVSNVVAPLTAIGGDTVELTWTVENVGNQPTPRSVWRDTLWLANGPDPSDPGFQRRPLGSRVHSGELLPTEQYDASFSVELPPDAVGTHFFVETFRQDDDLQTDNNLAFFASDVQPLAPADFTIAEVNFLGDAFSGEPIEVQWSVQNIGADAFRDPASLTDLVFLSRDAELILPRATLLGVANYANERQGAGTTVSRSETFDLPAGADGDYFIHIVTAAETSSAGLRYPLYESDTTNNGFTAPISITYAEPDLEILSDVTPAGDLPAGSTQTVSMTIANSGTRATRETEWSDSVFLSTDANLDDGDTMLATFLRSGALEINESYQADFEITLRREIAGEYFLIYHADAIRGNRSIVQWVPEFQDEANNQLAVPISITAIDPPDLQVLDPASPANSIIVPDRSRVDQPFELTYTIANVGDGDIPENQRGWSEWIYLSRDTVLDRQADHFIGSVRNAETLLSGDTITRTLEVTPPRGLVGAYYVIVVADPESNSVVWEGDNERNNVRAAETPVIIETPPPADLRIDSDDITFAASTAQSGTEVTVSFTVTNDGNDWIGRWADAVYLSRDGVWDLEDTRLGFVDQNTLIPGVIPSTHDPLETGESYTATLTATIPPLAAGDYRFIVRADIFDEIHEDASENNNHAVSVDSIRVSVDTLTLGVPRIVDVAASERQLFAVGVPSGQTLRVSIRGEDDAAIDQIILRHASVPSANRFDAIGQSDRITGRTEALLGGTEAGTYYVLLNNLYQGVANREVELVAELVPLAITDVSDDVGGDGRWVTLTIE
ncbi:MAG: CARDB domain-containing protein, partial [Planctomycetota bacterium]